jgi:hypothetical protein
MFQFPPFPILTDRSEEHEVTFGHRRFKGSLRLPDAYRSLARPSSVLEPSNSPNGVASRRRVRLRTRPDLRMTGIHRQWRALRPAMSLPLPRTHSVVWVCTGALNKLPPQRDDYYVFTPI